MKLSAKLLLLFILLPLLGFAQQEKKDSVQVKTSLYGFWLGTDLSKAAVSLFDDERKFYEVNAAADFGRFILNADLGSGTAEESGELGAFRSEGTYWRAGVDYNLTRREQARHTFFVGARYGSSSFTEQLAGVQEYLNWPVTPVVAERDATAWWVEANTGLKVRVYGPLFLGYTVRLMFGLNTKGTDDIEPYYVPGFGRANDNSNFQINYHLFFYLPTKKLK